MKVTLFDRITVTLIGFLQELGEMKVRKHLILKDTRNRPFLSSLGIELAPSREQPKFPKGGMNEN